MGDHYPFGLSCWSGSENYFCAVFPVKILINRFSGFWLITINSIRKYTLIRLKSKPLLIIYSSEYQNRICQFIDVMEILFFNARIQRNTDIPWFNNGQVRCYKEEVINRNKNYMFIPANPLFYPGCQNQWRVI